MVRWYLDQINSDGTECSLTISESVVECAIKEAKKKIGSMGLKYDLHIEDDGEDISIIFEVEEKSYDRILELWDEVAKEVFREIGQQEGVEIILKKKPSTKKLTG